MAADALSILRLQAVLRLIQEHTAQQKLLLAHQLRRAHWLQVVQQLVRQVASQMLLVVLGLCRLRVLWTSGVLLPVKLHQLWMMMHQQL